MSDATPAYRGYRLQALYILSRILEPDRSANLVFHPEGTEDVAIWQNDNHLVESIQVKAYSSNLNLSVFEPAKADSFIYRAYSLFEDHPGIKIKIASFGVIGPELLNAIQEDSKDRKNVAQKIKEFGFLTKSEACTLLSRPLARI